MNPTPGNMRIAAPNDFFWEMNALWERELLWKAIDEMQYQVQINKLRTEFSPIKTEQFQCSMRKLAGGYRPNDTSCTRPQRG